MPEKCHQQFLIMHECKRNRKMRASDEDAVHCAKSSANGALNLNGMQNEYNFNLKKKR